MGFTEFNSMDEALKLLVLALGDRGSLCRDAVGKKLELSHYNEETH